MCFSSGPDTSSNYHPPSYSLADSQTAVDKTQTKAPADGDGGAKGGIYETTLADPPPTTTPADSVAFSGTNYYQM